MSDPQRGLYRKRYSISNTFEPRGLAYVQSPNWSLARCFFLCMGGFLVNMDGGPTRFSPGDVVELLKTNVLSWSNKSLEHEALDCSKADWA